jgi:exodeoxyribonuclease VII large subunit
MSNIAQFSVSEFSRLLKTVVEDAFGYVKISGEVSGLKLAASGHVYFSLKDKDAVLSAVCFKDFADLIDFEIADGLQIAVSGRVTTYGARSSYQIIVEKAEIAGIGAIMEMLEKRREKLAKEGLFDESYKKQLPFFARKIAVITSLQGAVIKDILHRVEARCPTEILIYNAAMQGKTCAKEVVAGIKFFDKLKGDKRPDLLIIARGGGSVEDLLGFSDENLIREAFKCKLPIISAIGHETDFSLLDFVADLRAPTPTAAAEIATILFDDVCNQMDYLQNRLKNCKNQILREKQEKLHKLIKFIRKPAEILAKTAENFENLSKNLDFHLKFNFEVKKRSLDQIILSKNEILAKIERKEQKTGHFYEFFALNSQNFLKNLQNKLENLNNLLEAKNYKAVLQRGFALVKDKNGNLISKSASLKSKQEIVIEFRDGEVEAYAFGSKNRKEILKESDEIQPKLL